MRQVIMAQFAILDRICPSSHTAATLSVNPHDIQDETIFDNLDMDETLYDAGNLPSDPQSFHPSNSAENNDVHMDPPEKKRLPLPSTFERSEGLPCSSEMELRLIQAGKILAALRDLIAEKSFQFSHVIRIAPRKGVRTRARAEIAKLNDKIAYYCRVYTHCRMAMVRLGADDEILSRYRVLEKKDIASSGALLNPNEPGSTTLRLSWIWQTGYQADNSNAQGLYECKVSIYISIYYIYLSLTFVFYIVNRVHWLRARAQKLRWKEEFVLVAHEMEWTVRYYIHQSKVWKTRGSVANDMGDNGAAVYASRMQAMWFDMALSSDSQFRINCASYKFDMKSL